MKRKRYTIVVMPPNGHTRSYVLGRWFLRLVLGFSLLLTLALIASLTWAVWLRDQNHELRDDYEQKAAELENAHQYLEDLRELDANIRGVLFDDSETVGLGQGGFDTDIPEGMNPSAVASPDTVSPESEDPLPSSIVDYAQLVHDRFKELHTKIEQQRSLYNGLPSILPIQVIPGKKSYWFSSGYGYRIHPLTGVRQFHRGLDISTRRGTPIIATADGIVTFAGKDRYLGLVVRIRHQSFQGEHVTTYGHMKAFAEGLKKVDEVTRRQVIGYVGRSGWTTGSHLHYEVTTNKASQNPWHYIIREPQGRIH